MATRPQYSQLTLEQYVLKELPDELMQQISNEITYNRDLQSQVEAIEQSNIAFFNNYPAQEQLVAITAKKNSDSVFRKLSIFFEKVTNNRWFMEPRKLAPLLTLFIVTGLVILVLPNSNLNSDNISLNEIRLKGLDDSLFLFIKRNNTITKLQSNDTVSENDVIQIEYKYPSDAYAVIYSLDGLGNLSTHLPYRYFETGKTKRQALKQSFKLDNAPNFEQFIYLWSRNPFDSNTIISHIRNANDKHVSINNSLLPSGVKMNVIRLKKEG